MNKNNQNNIELIIRQSFNDQVSGREEINKDLNQTQITLIEESKKYANSITKNTSDEIKQVAYKLIVKNNAIFTAYELEHNADSYKTNEILKQEIAYLKAEQQGIRTEAYIKVGVPLVERGTFSSEELGNLYQKK